MKHGCFLCFVIGAAVYVSGCGESTMTPSSDTGATPAVMALPAWTPPAPEATANFRRFDLSNVESVWLIQADGTQVQIMDPQVLYDGKRELVIALDAVQTYYLPLR